MATPKNIFRISAAILYDRFIGITRENGSYTRITSAENRGCAANTTLFKQRVFLFCFFFPLNAVFFFFLKKVGEEVEY